MSSDSTIIIRDDHPINLIWYFIFSVNDALDDILADSDDESEEQAVITQVLDEIGIEISGKVS